jgi:transcription elongation factor GreA
MEDKEIYITAAGLQKLKDELYKLENVKLKNIAQKIAEAKDLGDLAENAEYHEAKEEQAFLNGKAQELRYKIKYAKIIENNRGSGTVVVGSKVKVKFGQNDLNLTLVGSDESDPSNGMISVDSPIGRALLNHKVRDKVLVNTPSGKTDYQILEIS